MFPLQHLHSFHPHFFHKIKIPITICPQYITQLQGGEIWPTFDNLEHQSRLLAQSPSPLLTLSPSLNHYVLTNTPTTAAMTNTTLSIVTLALPARATLPTESQTASSKPMPPWVQLLIKQQAATNWLFETQHTTITHLLEALVGQQGSQHQLSGKNMTDSHPPLPHFDLEQRPHYGNPSPQPAAPVVVQDRSLKPNEITTFFWKK